ncbi:MAG: MaoC family dehydratase [Candidatus Binatia bacterium]
MSDGAFDRIEVGDELPMLAVTLTGAEVRHFSEVANMRVGRFMSDEEARAAGMPGQIVPGNMSLALLSRVLTQWNPQATLRRLSATFRNLVRPGMPLWLGAVVTEKHASDHGDFVECDVWMENADGERLVTGTATLEF